MSFKKRGGGVAVERLGGSFLQLFPLSLLHSIIIYNTVPLKVTRAAVRQINI